MTCCIVGLFLLVVVGRIRRAFGLIPDEAQTLFAPMAQRPAPGQTLAQPSPAAVEPRPAGAAVFRYAALGIAACLTVVPMLAWTGVVENTGSTPMWLLRGSAISHSSRWR